MDELTTLNNNKLLLSNNTHFYTDFESSDSTEYSYYPLFELKIDYQNDFSIIFSTKGIEELGYNTDIINSGNMKFNDLMSVAEFDYFKNIFNKQIEDNNFDFICNMKFFDSNMKTRHTYAHMVITHTGKNSYLNCMVIDITNQYVDRSKEKRAISIIISDDIALLQHRICNCSNGNKLMLEFASDSLIYYGFDNIILSESSVNFFDFLHTEDYGKFCYLFNSTIEKKNNYFAGTYRIITPDSEIIWILIQTIVYYKDDVPTYINSVINDLTEQKERIIKLNENQMILENNLNRTQFISDILKHLQKSDDFKTSINTITKKLAIFLNASEIKICVPYSTSQKYITYSYNKSHNIQQKIINFKLFEDKYPNIIKRLNSFGMAYRDKLGSSKNCYNEFLSTGDYSYLIYNIKFTDSSDGFIILIDKDNTRTWDNETISVVSDITQIISSMFQRYLTQLELMTTLNTFKTVLNNIGSYVCVSTLEGQDIIFTNQKFSDNFGDDSIGKHLWECLGIDSEDYESITNSNSKINSKRARYYEIYSPMTKQWIDITQMNIIWVDGSIVSLSTLNNITQKIEYEKLIEMQAMNDHLTGLPNRRRLEKDFQDLVDQSLRDNTFGYILFLDLDNFKNVNDGLGHQYGDTLLQNISEFLKTLPYTGHYTYRFGGDEFILLVENKYCNQINDIVNTLLERFREKWDLINTTYYCTMSMGIAKYPYDGITLFEILKKVDMAMYRAKNQGKNRAMFYKNKIGFDSIRNIELERYLRESVSNSCNGFSVYYQPIVNAETKAIEGAEALLRWSCDNLGNISPVEFIPVAENLGFIVELGEFVFRTACLQCKKMISLGMKDFKISINLSVYQIYEANFLDKVEKIINETQVPYHNITFEVTESLAINDFKSTKEILKKLSELGISISLDDFGTGYSSLNNIKEMPLNTIKIDKSFIDDLINDSCTEVFVKTIISLAHALDMKVCAEGVEQEIQYNRLVDLNTDLIQGYLFGKPVPAEEFEKKYVPLFN